MKRFSLALWLSALALSGLIASCGGSGVIDDNLAATPSDQDYISDVPASFSPDPAEAAGERSASFTPGMGCWLPAGASWPSVLRYGWKGGLVSEGAFPEWVKLSNAIGAKPGWIMYQYKETAAGRLKNLRFFGSGNGMRIEVYNFNTALWTNFGNYNLGAGPANIVVPLAYATNGVSYVRLTETALSATRVDKIEAQVF